jgi:Zn-dependent protease with chaperone function
MMTQPRRAAVMAVVTCLTAVSALTVAPPPLLAQATQVKPGFNIFSESQDVEIGRQSAVQAERQLPMLNDRRAQGYATEIIRRLAAAAPGAKYPYQIRVVNASDINAFSLPGGYMYVNRGLIESARSESELAGVLAHEMAHVALRHGTHQASKAYMAQAGLGILGGLLGRGGNPSQIFQVIGGLGMNALFMKFSRDMEYQADTVGAQIMARAGYDPRAMADFFQVLRNEQRSNPSRLAQFFSDHPAPADRETRIRQEAQRIGAVQSSREIGGFAQVQGELRGMGRAPSMEQIARGQGSRNRRADGSYPGNYPDDQRYPNQGYPDQGYPDQNYPDQPYPNQRYPDQGGYHGNGTYGRVANIEPPSSRLATYRQRDGFFSIEYPENWRPLEPDNGFGVTIVPNGGVVDTGNGQQSIIYGVIVNHYDPFQASDMRRAPSLDEATQDLLTTITQSNQHLRPTGSRRRETIDGAPALSQVLSGRSPVTGEEERVTAFTRELPDGHVVYALFIAPGREYGTMAPVFSRMVRTLQVNDQVAHR